MSLPIDKKYRIPFFLDTNILVDYLDGTYPYLNQSLEFLSTCAFSELRSSHYVEYELVEVRKKILFFRKATHQNVTIKGNHDVFLLKIWKKLCHTLSTKHSFGKSPNTKQKTEIKKTWKFNNHDYNEFKDEIEHQVISELKLLRDVLGVNFDDHVLHDKLLSPTYQLVLKTKISREDCLVLTSCMLPKPEEEIDYCVILTRDSQFSKSYPDAKTVINGICHATPSMTNITAVSAFGHGNVNLCNTSHKAISDVWIPIIFSLIKDKNRDSYVGKTYKFGRDGDSAKCVYFNLQRNDNILRKSDGLCFITPNLSETIIKSVDDKDFYMTAGTKISILPITLESGAKVSFMPKAEENNDVAKIREKGCYVFFYDE